MVIFLFSPPLFAEEVPDLNMLKEQMLDSESKKQIENGEAQRKNEAAAANKIEESLVNTTKPETVSTPSAKPTPKVEKPVDLTPSRVIDINEKNAIVQEDNTSNALYTYAKLVTSMGTIRLKLYKKEAPRTVENFVGLATGEKSYRDLNTGKKYKDTPFYKKMVFHKVHPELGIQTGCPWGNGKGWPGFTIKNEANDLKFDRPFLVGMSRTQDNPNSMGSQFFITTAKSEHLDKTHTVFGEVVSGEDVVKKISLVKRDAMMKPLQPVMLEEILIE